MTAPDDALECCDVCGRWDRIGAVVPLAVPRTGFAEADRDPRSRVWVHHGACHEKFRAVRELGPSFPADPR
jgi:hypothetical protein